MSKTDAKKARKSRQPDPVAEDARLAAEAAVTEAAAKSAKAAQLQHLMDTGQRLSIKAADLNAQVEDIKKQIKALWPNNDTLGTYKAGEGVMVVARHSSINTDLADKLYGDRVKELKVTAAAIQAAGLTDEQVDALYNRSISVGWK